jgi:hypothetical protein
MDSAKPTPETKTYDTKVSKSVKDKKAMLSPPQLAQ